ncbi:MAG: class I SAM-dependent methyltransferase [Kiritimatiellae bacterium]|nr:class I SAM-dependent methyltransferase [Kiritimatiellia bacterium]
MEEYRPEQEKAAEKWNVVPDVHAEDFIYQYVLGHPGFETKQAAIQCYYDDGANSAKRLRELLSGVCRLDVNTPFDLFEFAAGYGCVSRHLKAAMPACNVLACDIHKQAVDFIRDVLGVDALLSDSCPEEMNTGGRLFKTVFALSFFSHMPKHTFSRWMKRLYEVLEPEGFLIFTTHGLESRRQYFGDCRYDAEGFHFRPLTEQKDLSLEEYGATAVHPAYVLKEAFRIPGLTLKFFQEGFWWEHQDVFVFQKKPGYGLDECREADASLRARLQRFLGHAVSRFAR